MSEWVYRSPRIGWVFRPHRVQARCDARGRRAQHVVNVLETGFWKIVEIHQAVREPEVPEGIENHLVLSVTRRVFDGETNFLERDVSMFVRAQFFRVGLLECAKQASFSSRLIVVAEAIVVMIPGSGIFQKRIGALQNPQVSLGDGLLAGLHTKLLPDPPADDDDAHDDGRHQDEPPSSRHLHQNFSSAAAVEHNTFSVIIPRYVAASAWRVRVGEAATY